METDKYIIENGMAFHKETTQRVREIIANVDRDQRIRVYYGDVKTGRDWCEEYDTMGYVGRTTGTYKIPILVHNTRSYGGGCNVRPLYCKNNY